MANKSLKSIKFPGLPDTYIVPQVDPTLSQSGQAADAKVVGFEIGKGNILDCFELGTINFPPSGWSYVVDDNRVRTRKGVTFSLKAGIKIGLTDYSKASFFAGWRDESGNYKYSGWKSSDFTCTDDGEYVILIRSNPETPQTDETELASLFRGYNVAFEHINSIESELNKYNIVSYKTAEGYITANGGIQAPSNNKEVYTSHIPVENGYVFNICLQYNTIHTIWISYGLYDKNGNFLSRTVLIDGRNTRQYKDFVTIENAEASYISFSYRSYDDSTFTIRCDNNIQIMEGNLSDEIEKNRMLLYAINENINSVNHRGYNTIAPENTLPAYKLSKKYGFRMVETDISFTSDGVAVLLHDDTINRTARNADGSAITETINITDITYDQALEYDFGIWKGTEFAETKIPTFEQFIMLCKYAGLHPYIELKPAGTTQERVEALVDTVAKYGLDGKITWISAHDRIINYVKNYNPKARLGYVVGNVTEDVIAFAKTLRTGENEIFIDSASYTPEEVALCQGEDIPMEVWTINTVSTLVNINPYVSGVTSDTLVVGYELCKKNIAI